MTPTYKLPKNTRPRLLPRLDSFRDCHLHSQGLARHNSFVIQLHIFWQPPKFWQWSSNPPPPPSRTCLLLVTVTAACCCWLKGVARPETIQRVMKPYWFHQFDGYYKLSSIEA